MSYCNETILNLPFFSCSSVKHQLTVADGLRINWRLIVFWLTWRKAKHLLLVPGALFAFSC